jgi:hypothetical protein
MSASTSYALTIRERLFEDSHVTPAVRANDTTDVHLARGGRYAEHPAHPFRTLSIDHAQCGHLDCAPDERSLGANLGLYRGTFNNDFRHDLRTLERFHDFREEAERKAFLYFLEVFDPNVPGALDPDVLPRYLNDMITRMLAGVAGPGRPQFLKIVYHGPKALEELVRFDPHLVVGILGGSAGTTRDAFQLLFDAQKYGARVALFGRKINNAENQLAFVQFLRLIVDGVIGPEEAVKAYHAVLQRLGIAPRRSLADDLALTPTASSYAGTKTTVTVPPMPQTSAPACACHTPAAAKTAGNGAPCHCHEPESKKENVASNGRVGSNGFPVHPDGRPDFARMDVSSRLAYHRERLGLGR